MTRRLGPLSLLLAIAAMAGDGISPRFSAEVYPAHVVAGKVSIGAAYVTPAQIRKLFGEDLDRHAYVVFEIGMFPAESAQMDVSADDFKLRQGKDTAILRVVSPRAVASDIHPVKSTPPPKLPSNVNIYTAETIGYEKGTSGHGGVYADATVTNYPTAPQAPQTSSTHDRQGLEEQLEQKGLPEGKTNHAVAGYIFFPKPTADKHADFELIYFGPDGQVNMKLSPAAKP